MFYITAGIGPISNIKMGKTENKRGGGGVGGVGGRTAACFSEINMSMTWTLTASCCESHITTKPYLEMLFVFGVQRP